MKKILIIGAGSYVGESVKSFLLQWPNIYEVDTVSSRDNKWKDVDFAGYDSIFHVAGIVHTKETKENKKLYYEVNRDMAVEVAIKAKAAGVRQFIFMSTMSVYGMDMGIITKDTPTNPKSCYADSKLQAEKIIDGLSDKNFDVCILRPPMIYGKCCKGNFQTVAMIVRKSPFFPKIDNQRSLIYIDNFSNFIKKAIDERLKGLYFPQNNEYMSTSKMAEWIAESIEKKLFLSAILGIGVTLIRPFSVTVKKAFGTLIYEDLEPFNFDYCVVGIEESVKKSI